MRLLTFRDGDRLTAGLLEGDRVIPLTGAASGLAHDPGHNGPSVKTLVGCAPEVLAAVAARAREANPDGLPLPALVLEAPVVDPDKIVCLGLNYDKHIDEFDQRRPEAPVLFAKFRNALSGTGAPVVLHEATSAVDYEGELAVVIGRECRHVSAADALDHVAGVMPFNDVSARDLQFATGQWLPGKMLDGFGPCGPCLVTMDEIDDVQDLVLTTRLNGEIVQQESTAAMIFKVAETIAYLSTLITLVPGDIVATGTPDGVGAARVPPRYLAPGDTVEVEISGVGTLSNTMRAAAAAAVEVS